MNVKYLNINANIFLNTLNTFYIQRLFVSLKFDWLPSMSGCFSMTKSVNQDSVIILGVKMIMYYARMNKNFRSTLGFLKATRNAWKSSTVGNDNY